MAMKLYLKESETEDIFETLQYILYIFNTVFFLFAAIVFAIGIYVTFDSDVQEYMDGLSLDFYLRGVAILIAAATITCLNALIGCCGVFLISKKTLIVHITVTAISFILLLSGSAYLLKNGLSSSDLAPAIEDSMKELINLYMIDVTAKTTVDKVQETIECCGGSGYDDYISIHLPIPDTCRDKVTGNQQGDGCSDVLSSHMSIFTGWMCGISLCICFLQIFETIATLFTHSYMTPIRRKILFQALLVHHDSH